MFCFGKKNDRASSDLPEDPTLEPTSMEETLQEPTLSSTEPNAVLDDQENDPMVPDSWVKIDENELKYIDYDDKLDLCPRASVDSDLGITSDSMSLSGHVEYDMTSSFSQRSAESLKNLEKIEKINAKLLQNTEKNRVSQQRNFFHFPSKVKAVEPTKSLITLPVSRNRSGRWKKRISATRRQLRLSPRSSTSNSTSSSANNSRSSSGSRDVSKITGMLIENCVKNVTDPLKIDIKITNSNIKNNLKANSATELNFSDNQKLIPNFSSASNLTNFGRKCETLSIAKDQTFSEILNISKTVKSVDKLNKSGAGLKSPIITFNPVKIKANGKPKLCLPADVVKGSSNVDLTRVASVPSLYGLSTSSGDISAQSTPTSSSSSIRQSSIESNGSGLWPPLSPSALGPRFKLLHEGDIQVCHLNHTRTVISKILSSKFLRRWETHHLYMRDTCIASKTPGGFLEQPISYHAMQEVYVVARWDAGNKFCLRIVVPDGSILLQAGNAYTRDQWYHSIVWKKNISKYKNILSNSTRHDVILKELKGLVEFATSSPLTDECVYGDPIAIVSELLTESTSWSTDRSLSDCLLQTLCPLLESTSPSPEMCRHFSQHCVQHPRSPFVVDALVHVVLRILKHNVDFSRAPHMRLLVQQFLKALHTHNGARDVIRKFVASIHGPASTCPHPRVLPNIVSVCLAAIFSFYENQRNEDGFISDGILKNTEKELNLKKINLETDELELSESKDDGIKKSYDQTEHHLELTKIIDETIGDSLIISDDTLVVINAQKSDDSESKMADESVELSGVVVNVLDVTSKTTECCPESDEDIVNTDCELLCYLSVFDYVSEYDDWRPGLAQLLQPLPFPDGAVQDAMFLRALHPVAERMASDSRCSVHGALLGVRDAKAGWFNVFCPNGDACPDGGELWCEMLGTLLHCCCRRKRFLSSLMTTQLSTCLLLALRERKEPMEVLGLLLEWDLVENTDQRLQIVSTLQSTDSGKEVYDALCQKQQHLKELQQKGGPKKLTLPSRSTDEDVTKLLSSGSFGNLECLSLAFTHITSASAEQIIKLPSLRYLNLWATQFSDAGLQLISEHLPDLQVLNLCETQVTDVGISTLSSLTKLRKLNLNSTKLTADTYKKLKNALPKLQDCDVRYTEAW